MHAYGNGSPGDLQKVHRVVTAFGTGEEIDTEDTHQQQRGTAHQHQGQLHGRVFLAARAPHPDQQVHRDQRHFIEEEHREEVDRNEKAVNPRREQAEPQEKLFGQRIDLPRRKHTREHNHRRKQQHRYRNSVYPDRIIDIERREPRHFGHEKHFGIVPGGAFTQEEERQHDREHQQ